MTIHVATTATAAPAPVNVDIAARAMLVQLTVRQWSGRKLDKAVTDRINRDHGAAADAGRYNKALIAKDALAEIQQIVGAARADHVRLSLPWLQDGSRIMPAAAFDRYAETMRGHRERFEAAVGDLVAAYPAYVDDARDRLNGMFNESDYPAPADLRRRFGWQVTVLPMPDAADFRVDLSQDRVAAMRAEIEATMAAAVQDAMADAWHRLHDVVKAMAEKLRAYRPKTDTERAQGVFRDSLVGNVRDLVAILPALNLTGDARLADLVARADAELTAADPAELREDAARRDEVAAAAESIMADMAAFMGG